MEYEDLQDDEQRQEIYQAEYEENVMYEQTSKRAERQRKKRRIKDREDRYYEA